MPARLLGNVIRMSSSATTKQDVAGALKAVVSKVDAAVKRSSRSSTPRIVAVGKWKPAELLQEAYDAGHRDFGENYVQEICDKATAMPKDIRWHFIGHLQSNKTKALVEGVPNLAMLETVDSEKVAKRVDAAIEAHERDPLAVMIQVNTSGEETKFGVEPAEAVTLATYIHEQCKHLRLAGLMTIGQPDYTSRPENFECLSQCRHDISKSLGMDEQSLELSMGMSGDFERAVEMGSTNVRVGSTIFGARDYENKS